MKNQNFLLLVAFLLMTTSCKKDEVLNDGLVANPMNTTTEIQSNQTNFNSWQSLDSLAMLIKISNCGGFLQVKYEEYGDNPMNYDWQASVDGVTVASSNLYYLNIPEFFEGDIQVSLTIEFSDNSTQTICFDLKIGKYKHCQYKKCESDLYTFLQPGCEPAWPILGHENQYLEIDGAPINSYQDNNYTLSNEVYKGGAAAYLIFPIKSSSEKD